MLAGDHIYKMDYAMMLAEHLEQDADEHRGVARADRVHKRLWDRYRCTTPRICGFVEKPPEPAPCFDDSSVAFASMGVYCFDTGNFC
ncbi:MAG: hypothetical protein IPH22_13010 [Nitrosomonas sp.]|nr:hypothetical protein [Nitrosomonas sp.]